MKLQQDFTIERPVDAVWAFFHDVPALATCLPGAEYRGSTEGGRHAGKVSSRLGPFQTSFEGEAAVTYDEAARSIALDGKGVDRKGNSRGKMALNCEVVPAGAGATKVKVASDIQLSGAIAQFGRTGLIEEVANVLVSDFVRNVEAAIPPPAAAAPEADHDAPRAAAPGSAAVPHGGPARTTPVGGFGLMLRVLASWLRSKLGRSA